MISRDNSFENNDKTETHAVLTPEARIDHYRIIQMIGRGGMGEVYLAEDTTLDRKVALKFLSLQLYRDESFRARFIREAKAIAKISHSNIVHIYEVSESKGRPFYSMEMVEGEPLKELIRNKKLSLYESIEIAIQVAEGLCEVHDAGIIHRDIKPANILIDRKRRAKISDFGIALATTEERLTKTGAVLGTFGYMSPEQVKGESVDHRGDIFSFGALLYEMVTGKQPFINENEAATINAILKETPKPVSSYVADTPETLQLVIEKALSKKPENRYQKTADLLYDLKQLLQELPAPETTRITTAAMPVLSRLRRYRIALITGVLLIILLVALNVTHQPPDSTIPTQRRLTFFNGSYWGAISPNGRYFAFSLADENNGVSVWVRDIDADRAIKVFDADLVFDLNWSPDSKELLFAGIKGSISGIFLVPSLGGEYRLYNHHFSRLPSVTWSPDGTRFAINGSPVNPKGIVIFDKKSSDTSMFEFRGTFELVQSIAWSPKNDRFLFTSKSPNALWTCELSGKQSVKLADGIRIPPCWNPTGDAVYYLQWVGNNQDLKKISIDPKTGKPKSAAKVLLSGIRCSGAAEISVSTDGQKLICTKENRWSDLWLVSLNGESEQENFTTTKLSELAARHSWPSFSPDGKWLAYQILLGNGEAHLFVVSIDGMKRKRITYDNLLNFSPAWSPGGDRLALGTAYKRGDDYNVAVINLDGGTAKVFDSSLISENESKVIWAPGEKIIYQKRGNRNLGILDPATGAESTLFPEERNVIIRHAEYSSDGKRLAALFDPTPELPDEDPADSSGIWIFTLDGVNVTYLGNPGGFPIGWSDNDEWIYLVSGKNILRTNTIDKTVDTVITLPFDRLWKRASMARDGKNFACLDWNFITDIWLIESFDPNLN